jgi:uncharacterized membrane protein
MLLIQNLNALYPLYPRQAGSINMHFVFWVMLALMALYAAFGKREPIADAAAPESPPWRRWLAASAATFAFIILLASFINGEKTMTTAETRFPLWSWRSGPPKR